MLRVRSCDIADPLLKHPQDDLGVVAHLIGGKPHRQEPVLLLRFGMNARNGFQRVGAGDGQGRNRGAYNIAALFGKVGVSRYFKTANYII